MMLAAALVTVLIDGVLVDGSVAARMRDGVVVAPLAPYLTTIAERIESDPGGERFVFARGARSISVALGSRVARAGASVEELPVAPFLHGEETFVPLAMVARALGGDVAFDTATKTLSVGFEPEPLATLAPAGPWTPGPGPYETFAPMATPAPAPRSTGIPRPRRTPLVIDSHER
jgi:hypothetical protein